MSPLRFHLAILTALGLALASPADAEVAKIDFNGRLTDIGGWNVFGGADSGGTFDLMWTDGTDSGIDLSLPSGLIDSANEGWNPANALPSWGTTEGLNDYVFFNSATIVSLNFTGLDPTRLYYLELVSSRDLNRTQDMVVTSGPVVWNWNSQSDGWQAGGFVRWNDLTPTAGGVLTLRIRRDSVSANINAIRLIVPEPGTVSLLGAGALAITLRRRS